MKYHIKDPKLAPKGKIRFEWSESRMPVLRLIRDRFQKQKPLKNIRLSCCLHVTAETAVLMSVLKAGGANVVLCASNPLSTQDDITAFLAKDLKIGVFAIHNENSSAYFRHIKNTLAIKPNITMDDGADLVSTLHKEKLHLVKDILGGTEETTTGLVRLRAMEKKGVLAYPIIAVNDAQTKRFFDNRYGTGQSTVDGILRATNVLLAGKNIVVCGYGWCGKGAALRMHGLGANVFVCEINPVKALEASMDGHQVMTINQAAKIGDIFITVTGDTNVIDKQHFGLMKDGTILCNSGHFNVEINTEALRAMAKKVRKTRDNVEEFTLKNGKKLNLLAEGRLVNLACAEGHPAEVMDMSFANQALSVEYLVKNGLTLENKVLSVPDKIDQSVARLKLKALGIKIDQLTKQQRDYLESWQSGT
jgi:adenosylhomocysteinase